MKQHFLLLYTAWSTTFITSLGSRCQLHVFSLSFVSQGHQNEDRRLFAYFTYWVAQNIQFSVHSGTQRSIPLHFCKMKELHIFLENHSLPLAEAFDKCLDVGQVICHFLQNRQVFLFVCLFEEAMRSSTKKLITCLIHEKGGQPAVSCLKSCGVSALLN